MRGLSHPLHHRFRVAYDDGDTEDLEWHELEPLLLPEGGGPKSRDDAGPGSGLAPPTQRQEPLHEGGSKANVMQAAHHAPAVAAQCPKGARAGAQPTGGRHRASSAWANTPTPAASPQTGRATDVPPAAAPGGGLPDKKQQRSARPGVKEGNGGSGPSPPVPSGPSGSADVGADDGTPSAAAAANRRNPTRKRKQTEADTEAVAKEAGDVGSNDAAAAPPASKRTHQQQQGSRGSTEPGAPSTVPPDARQASRQSAVPDDEETEGGGRSGSGSGSRAPKKPRKGKGQAQQAQQQTADDEQQADQQQAKGKGGRKKGGARSEPGSREGGASAPGADGASSKGGKKPKVVKGFEYQFPLEKVPVVEGEEHAFWRMHYVT